MLGAMLQQARRLFVGTLLATLVAPVVHAAAYRPPRLPDGQVNMQGIWIDTNLTPLQRPAEFKNLILSPAEAQSTERYVE